jgi:hypothetical protein
MQGYCPCDAAPTRQGASARYCCDDDEKDGGCGLRRTARLLFLFHLDLPVGERLRTGTDVRDVRIDPVGRALA